MFLSHALAIWFALGIVILLVKINEMFDIWNDSSLPGLIVYGTIASLCTGLAAWAFFL